MSKPNEKSQDCITTETYFGEYLTNQYELLKRTLSFLKIEDLLNAARVCKSWHQVARFITKKREQYNKFRWHLHGSTEQRNAANCYKGKIDFTSELVLGFQTTKSDSSWMQEIFSSRNRASGREIFIPGLFGNLYLIEFDRLEVPAYVADNVFKYYYGRNAVLFFPKSDRYTTVTDFISDEIELEQCLQNHDDLELKGLLVFTKEDNFILTKMLYDRILEEIKHPVALAGGMFLDTKVYTRNEWNSQDGLLTLFFRGDIDCYSDIITDSRKDNIEPFMKNMRQNLGTIDPKKQQRIAFVIRCVARKFGTYEDRLFQKYFPDTAAFVMESQGECGSRADSSKAWDDFKRARTEVPITYQYSTIYFFATIKVPVNE